MLCKPRLVRVLCNKARKKDWTNAQHSHSITCKNYCNLLGAVPLSARPRGSSSDKCYLQLTCPTMGTTTHWVTVSTAIVVRGIKFRACRTCVVFKILQSHLFSFHLTAQSERYCALTLSFTLLFGWRGGAGRFFWLPAQTVIAARALAARSGWAGGDHCH